MQTPEKDNMSQASMFRAHMLGWDKCVSPVDEPNQSGQPRSELARFLWLDRLAIWQPRGVVVVGIASGRRFALLGRGD